MKDLFIQIIQTVVGKITLVVIALGLVVGALYYANNKFNFSWSIFGDELKIEKTENVVTQIKKISEFTTACYYEEDVLKHNKAEAGIYNNLMSLMNFKAAQIKSEIVILTKGTVRSGYNLSKIADDDIHISSDTIRIKLPAPEIFDVIVNPSNYEIYVEDGNWSHEEVAKLQANYRDRLQKSAIASGILEKANTEGKVRCEELFKSLGFKVVEITTTED